MVLDGEARVSESIVIVFRTDASLSIGTGHVTRCLTLADGLRERGIRCLFVCRALPGNLLDRIRQREFEVLALPMALNKAPSPTPVLECGPTHAHLLGVEWAVDAEQTLASLQSLRVKWLIVDHYALDIQWEQRLRSTCQHLMVIDDLADRDHMCDLLLDQNLRSDAAQRYAPHVPPTCRLLLGPSHVLLGPSFNDPAPRERSGEVRSVLAYFGGNDSNNQAGRAVEALLRFPELQADVVLGHEHPHRASVFASAGSTGRVRVVDSCADMSAAMTRADLGLGTCGMAAWERCAVGLPTLVTISADNQREDAVALENLGAVELLGEAGDVDVGKWVDALGRALADTARMEQMGRMARSVVVGHQRNHRQLIDLLADETDAG